MYRFSALILSCTQPNQDILVWYVAQRQFWCDCDVFATYIADKLWTFLAWFARKFLQSPAETWGKGSCNGDKRPDPLPGSPGRLEVRRAAAAAASSGGNLVVPTEISFTPRRRPRLFPKTRSWPHGDWFEAMLGRVSSLQRKKIVVSWCLTEWLVWFTSGMLGPWQADCGPGLVRFWRI